MPVYDYTYRTWKGERRGPWFRWTAIPKFTYIEFFGKRVFIWLFTISWLQFVFRAGYVYLLFNVEFLSALNIPAAALPPVNAFFFKNMIDLQAPFCFLFAFLLGSGLVSRDLQHSAAVLYMSKPISCWEYFLGKFFTLFTVMMLVTWFQTTALFLVQTVAAPEHSEWRLYFWTENSWLPGAIALYSAVVSATLSLLILAASSLTKNSRYAGTTFAVYLIGSTVAAGIVGGIFRNGNCLALSPVLCGGELGYYLFNLTEGREMSQPAAWGGLFGVWILCAMILYWRLKTAARCGR